MHTIDQAPPKTMILISLVQGFCLLYLHQAIELGFWPNHLPHWLFALYSIAFILPTMLLLSLRAGNTRGILKLTLPFVLLSALLGYYVGYQATPIDHVRFNALLAAYVLTMTIATFKSLMYSQQIAAGEPVSYSALFLWSWRNFLIIALSLLFAGCIWLIFMLWAALFKAIEIDFFANLFKEPWFFYPTVALANGFGIIIFRSLTNIIDTITRLQQALMKFLLIFLVLISLLFLGALPFTGLDPLWKSGGSALILWMQALILFFVNGVYQDNPEQRPYAIWLHRFIYVGIALLPIYSAISFYGLSLRVDQYGWSQDRCWAFLIWFLLALFPLGYWWGIAKWRDAWVYQLSRVNVVVGALVLVAMLLVNSPLLDFRKIVVNDQLNRLANNPVLLDEFDFNYFRWSLARPGYEGLQEIKALYGKSHPQIVVRINELYRDPQANQAVSTKEEFVELIEVLAGDPPPTLLDAIYQNEAKNAWAMQNARKYYLRPIDLNQDGEIDYLLASAFHRSLSLTLYYFKDSQWQQVVIASGRFLMGKQSPRLIEALKTGDFQITRPEWNDLEIGGTKFHVRENALQGGPEIIFPQGAISGKPISR